MICLGDSLDLNFEVKSLQKLNEEFQKEIALNKTTIASQRQAILDKNAEIESLLENAEKMKGETGKDLRGFLFL